MNYCKTTTKFTSCRPVERVVGIKADSLNVQHQTVHFVHNLLYLLRISSHCLQLRTKDVVEFFNCLCFKKIENMILVERMISIKGFRSL